MVAMHGEQVLPRTQEPSSLIFLDTCSVPGSVPQAALSSLHPQHTQGGDPGAALTRILPPGLRVQPVPLASSSLASSSAVSLCRPNRPPGTGLTSSD